MNKIREEHRFTKEKIKKLYNTSLKDTPPEVIDLILLINEYSNVASLVIDDEFTKDRKMDVINRFYKIKPIMLKTHFNLGKFFEETLEDLLNIDTEISLLAKSYAEVKLPIVKEYHELLQEYVKTNQIKT